MSMLFRFLYFNAGSVVVRFFGLEMDNFSFICPKLGFFRISYKFISRGQTRGFVGSRLYVVFVVVLLD